MPFHVQSEDLLDRTPDAFFGDERSAEQQSGTAELGHPSSNGTKSEVDYGVQIDCEECRLPNIASHPTHYSPYDTDTASNVAHLSCAPVPKMPTIPETESDNGEINSLKPTTIGQETAIAGNNHFELIIFDFDQTLSTMHISGILVQNGPWPDKSHQRIGFV